MKDLAFTQEFFLCALKPQGSTTLTGSIVSSTCLFTGTLLELLMGAILRLMIKIKC